MWERLNVWVLMLIRGLFSWCLQVHWISSSGLKLWHHHTVNTPSTQQSEPNGPAAPGQHLKSSINSVLLFHSLCHVWKRKLRKLFHFFLKYFRSFFKCDDFILKHSVIYSKHFNFFLCQSFIVEKSPWSYSSLYSNCSCCILGNVVFSDSFMWTCNDFCVVN